MNTDKLVKAIQIIVKQELKEVIPPLVKEGVKKEMRKLLKEEQLKSKPPITNSANINTEENFMDESVVEQPTSSETTQSKKVLSKNPVINQILQETKPFADSKRTVNESNDEWKTMKFDSSDTHTVAKKDIVQQYNNGGRSSGPSKGGLGVNTGLASLDRILNRDNSELVKAFNRKKGS